MSTSTPVEISLMLASVANGDAGAFERLYQATSAKIYGVVLRIVRRHDLAADVMEETYLHIWKTAAKFDPALASPMGWMMAIARARAIDLARRPDIVASDADPEIADNESPGALSRRELTDELKRLLTCIGRLEPDRQRMLLLAYYGAFTRDELAEQARHSRQPAQGVAAAQPVRDRAMSDVVSNDELNALAAEYVLGTLDYEERKGASALLEVDPTFRGIVRIWERRFGDLHLMVEAVEPDPQLWVRIKPKMAGVEQIAPAIPSSKWPRSPPRLLQPR